MDGFGREKRGRLGVVAAVSEGNGGSSSLDGAEELIEASKADADDVVY